MLHNRIFPPLKIFFQPPKEFFFFFSTKIGLSPPKGRFWSQNGWFWPQNGIFVSPNEVFSPQNGGFQPQKRIFVLQNIQKAAFRHQKSIVLLRNGVFRPIIAIFSLKTGSSYCRITVFLQHQQRGFLFLKITFRRQTRGFSVPELVLFPSK